MWSLRRKSFFGGTVSTRLEAAAPHWNAQPAPALNFERGSKRNQPGARYAAGFSNGPAAGHGPAGVGPEGAAGGAAAPKRDAGEAKRKRQAQLDDYSALQAGIVPAPKMLASQPARKWQASSMVPGGGAQTPPQPSLSPATQKWLEQKSPMLQPAAAGANQSTSRTISLKPHSYAHSSVRALRLACRPPLPPPPLLML